MLFTWDKTLSLTFLTFQALKKMEQKKRKDFSKKYKKHRHKKDLFICCKKKDYSEFSEVHPTLHLPHQACSCLSEDMSEPGIIHELTHRTLARDACPSLYQIRATGVIFISDNLSSHICQVPINFTRKS